MKLRIALVTILLCASSFALDRTAFSFTKYDLNVTVDRQQHAIDVDGSIEIRNTSKSAQSAVPVQISSSLSWRRIAIGDQLASFVSNTYTSDIDHSGALSEAIVTLAKPLAPGASVTFNIHYGGTIDKDSSRLTRIGTPRAVALRSDWDEISEQFTAVRGVGYVTWYPVSIEGASLTNGDEVYDALAGWRQRERDAKMTVALGALSPDEAKPGVVTTGTPINSGINPRAHGRYEFNVADGPAFVVANQQRLERPNVTIDFAAEHTQLARDYVNAAEAALNIVKETFGEPKEKATIIELADPDALPYESGTFLFVPLRKSDPNELQVALARLMTHICFDSPRPWVREGLATFAQALVRERQGGRKAALEYLNQFTDALTTAEHGARSTAAQGESTSKTEAPAIGPQPLINTNDELFYRTKAAFVWWMLRDIVGEDAIKSFTSRYNREQDARDPNFVERTLQAIAGQKRDLAPFFDTWVYRDRGLAELRVAAAYPREILSGSNNKPENANYLVTVTVENTGDTWVEAPVVLRSGRSERVERIAVEPHSKAVARVSFLGKPQEAIVNDGSVPEEDVSDNRAELK